MKALLTAALPLLFLSCTTPTPAKETTTYKQPSEYFPTERTQVLVVGTFHFDYPGLDANVTPDEDKIDVLQEPKKSEVDELVAYIKRFKPTKIAIEAFPTWNGTAKLREYGAGQLRGERDERVQLGLRLANDLELDTIYALDAEELSQDLSELDSTFTENLFKDFDFRSNDPMDSLYRAWYTAQDELVSKTNLLEYFKQMNTREAHQYGYGAYLVGDFKLDNGRGADILSVWWYNRNLRIFRKLQEITQGTNDRILVIFGNGHAAILRQLLESSPEYDFVEFDGL